MHTTRAGVHAVTPAPADLEPDPLLVEAHEGEALAFGRTDLMPRVLSAAQLVDKAKPANCDANLYPNVNPLSWASQLEQEIGLDGQSFYLCAGSPKKTGSGNPVGCVRHDNRKAITVGVCNDTNSVHSTAWTYFLTGIQPLTAPSPAIPGTFQRLFLNPQVPPGGVVNTRSLAVRSSNNAAFVGNTHYQKSGLTTQ